MAKRFVLRIATILEGERERGGQTDRQTETQRQREKEEGRRGGERWGRGRDRDG